MYNYDIYIYIYIYIYIIQIIMFIYSPSWCHIDLSDHLLTRLYRSLHPGGLLGFILYRYKALVHWFKQIVLPLLVHEKRSTGVHRLWDRPYFSSCVPHVWFISNNLYIYIYIYNLNSYMNLHTHTHIHIYIYIFTNLISNSIHGTRKKQKKKLPGTRDKSISNHRPTPWKKSRDTQSVVKRKLKTFRESCNATITKVLNIFF